MRGISCCVVSVAWLCVSCTESLQGPGDLPGDSSRETGAGGGSPGGEAAGGDTGTENTGTGNAGTGGAGTAGTGGAGTAGSTGTEEPPPFEGEQFHLEIGPITVQPGEEDTVCVLKRLSNTEAVKVGQIDNTITSSSHHMIVYRTHAEEERTEPFECAPFLDTLNPEAGAPLMVTQKYADTLRFPDGVGISLEPEQMIRLELHYINPTPDPVEVTAKSTFSTLSPAEFKDEADFLFIGNPDLHIPARSEWTLGPSFLPLPAEFSDAKFFAITGHTHQYGTNVTVEVAESETGSGTPVYDVEDWKWDEPDTVVHTPPFQIPPDGGFRFTCDWLNTSDSPVTFGESANKEMCFFWAYYYPSKGAKVCVRSDEYGVTLCCPGNPLCSSILSYL